MDSNFILKQTKEVTMTQDKTVTVFRERLEEADRLGRVSLKMERSYQTVDYHGARPCARRIA